MGRSRRGIVDDDPRPHFDALAEMAERNGVSGLSMGMSDDFEIAIEEGATVVRVGQALFGARPLPDSHYWPANPQTKEPRS